MTEFEEVLETILEEYARRDTEGDFDTWEETDSFVKEKAEVLLAYANLKEEPASKELEEAADKFVKSYTKGGTKQSWLKEGYIAGAKWQKEKEYTCYEEAFEDGAKWQKEKMMVKAIDGKVLANGMGNPILHLWDKGRHLVDKKVKVIVINED